MVILRVVDGKFAADGEQLTEDLFLALSLTSDGTNR